MLGSGKLMFSCKSGNPGVGCKSERPLERVVRQRQKTYLNFLGVETPNLCFESLETSGVRIIK
jgi:hypothetical protein